jgi:N-glycosylase/DNA lyase
MKQKYRLEYLISWLCSDMQSARLPLPSFSVEQRPDELWKHKVFCILSSQFNAERAARIAEEIVNEIPFFDPEYSTLRIEAECFSFLSRPDARHRFPKVRARQISQSRFPFLQIKDCYQEFIRSFSNEEEARAEIIELYPGVGIKQASMFLRNIGASKNLSVVDVHVLFYLSVCHDWNTPSLTPRRYLQAESIMRKDADRRGLDLNVFDTIVWTAARAMKKAERHV